MQIFHIATAADWAEAQRTGVYTTSTLGRTLEEEGFLHASRRDQVQPTFRRHYTGVREPLVLLTIETDRLASPWREDNVGDATYPHIHGPLHPDEVIRVQPLNRRGGTDSLTELFVREMAARLALAFLAMGLAFGGAALLRPYGGGWPLVGALAGLGIGIATGVWITRRRG